MYMWRHESIVRALLLSALFLLAGTAHASLIIPITGFGCTRAAYDIGSGDCTAEAAVQQLSDNGSGIQGVKYYLSSPEAFVYDPSGSEPTGFTPWVTFTSNGPLYGTVGGHTCTLGDNSGCGSLALPAGSTVAVSYEFTINFTGDAILSSWFVELDFPGAFPFQIHGSGNGTFSDTVTAQTGAALYLGNNATFSMTVEGIGDVPLGGHGGAIIDVPSNSLDLTGAVGAPEPASLLLCLPVLALLRRRSIR
jgi:hypothetical protein